jgi:hypothetical protein
MFKAISLIAMAVSGLGMQLKTQAGVQAGADQISPAITILSGPNVLAGAKATQASPAYDEIYGSANHAIDGLVQCNWVWSGANSLTHTNQITNPWWQADMGQNRNIKMIKVFNRDDCCSDRLANYQVRIGNNADIWLNPACPGTFTGSQTIECDLSGRYLGITLPGTNRILTLCEVQAFEVPKYNQLKAVSANQISGPYGNMGLASKAIDGRKECSW